MTPRQRPCRIWKTLFALLDREGEKEKEEEKEEEEEEEEEEVRHKGTGAKQQGNEEGTSSRTRVNLRNHQARTISREVVVHAWVLV